MTDPADRVTLRHPSEPGVFLNIAGSGTTTDKHFRYIGSVQQAKTMLQRSPIAEGFRMVVPALPKPTSEAYK